MKKIFLTLLLSAPALLLGAQEAAKGGITAEMLASFRKAQTTDKAATTADFIQIIVDFLTHHFGSQTQSYNIFFYDLGGRIAVKLLPRFATPPIFVGYGIHFRPSSLDEAIHAIRQRYF